MHVWGLRPSEERPLVLGITKLVQWAARAYTLNNIKEMKPC